MVGMILCFSVVAKIKMACAGGSSSVFRKALKACCDSMCTSSMMYTLNLPVCGAKRTWSISLRISSTELFEAASSSKMLSANSSSFKSAPPLITFARIRAQVVFPTPRGPQNNRAWAKWSLSTLFSSVSVICDCPTTASKACGRYFLADTTNCSIGQI